MPDTGSTQQQTLEPDSFHGSPVLGDMTAYQLLRQAQNIESALLLTLHHEQHVLYFTQLASAADCESSQLRRVKRTLRTQPTCSCAPS